MFVVYFILITGLIARLVRTVESNGEMISMITPIFLCFFLIAIISTLSFWFERLDAGFNEVAETINENFGAEPFEVTEALLKTVSEDPEAEGWGVERIVNSVYLSIVYGLSKLAVITAALFQIPFYLLQYILKWLGYLLLPIALALFAFPSLRNIGVKIISNLLAVLAWPIGFAITNLAAMGFINDFATAATFSGNDTGVSLYMMSSGSLIMGIIAALILIVGTISTPVIMFVLFSSGAALQAITSATTGTALFAAYALGGLGLGAGAGAGAATAGGSAGASSGGSGGGGGGSGGPSPTSGFAGSSSSASGNQLNESSSSQELSQSQSNLAPLSHYRSSTATTSTQPSLSLAKPKALPGPQSSANPLLLPSPDDPSGESQAAKLLALSTTPRPVTGI